MYLTVAQLVKDGKRIGFLFIYQQNQVEMLDAEIKTRMKQGEQFDIYFSGTKFYFKDSRKITDLPVVKSKPLSIFTGLILRNLVQRQISNYKERDFVSSICEYVSSDFGRVVAISGLRGIGKGRGRW